MPPGHTRDRQFHVWVYKPTLEERVAARAYLLRVPGALALFQEERAWLDEPRPYPEPDEFQ